MLTYTVKDLVPILLLKPRAISRLLINSHLDGRIVGRQWIMTEEDVRKFLGAWDNNGPE